MTMRPTLSYIFTIFCTVIFVIAALACGNPLKEEGGHGSTRPPNIVLFLADDHGQWAASPYGNEEVQTPALDSLAASGIMMANATCTSPVCSPARTSLLTGRLPSQHGIHDFLSEQPDFNHDWLAGEVLLPELLQQAGYRTALIGKWHCTATSLEPQRSFDRWLSYDQGPEGWPNQYLHQGTVHLSDQGSPVSIDGFQLEHLGRAAREFIASGDPEQPYFLLFAPTDTHAPFTGHPEEWVENYRSLNHVPTGETLAFPAANAASLAPDDIGEILAQYYAAVSHQDTELAHFLDLLEARGELEDTLVIYTSDHGLMVGHHGLVGKSNATLPQNLYEESIRVPMILSWPEGLAEAGISLDLPFDHLDLFQTILDAAGLELGEDLQKRINSPGQSLLPKLRNPETPWRRYRFTEHGNARQINDGHYKLVRRYPPLDPRFSDELYDLETDPRENVNLIDAPDFREVSAELNTALEEHFKRFEVPEHSGRTVIDQPPCNGIEPWRKVADQLVDAEVLSAPPQNPDVTQHYLFYQHGKIVEGSDGHPVHPRFGLYEYENILSTLSAVGFVVVSEIRPRDADVSRSAAKLKAGVESLLEAGVPPSHITLLGASKGGVITIRASNMLENRALRVVVLAGFFGSLKEDPQFQPWGAVLSVHDSSDRTGVDPVGFLEGANGVSEQRIVVTETGLGHGLLYSPHEAWLSEVLQWSGIQD